MAPQYPERILIITIIDPWPNQLLGNHQLHNLVRNRKSSSTIPLPSMQLHTSGTNLSWVASYTNQAGLSLHLSFKMPLAGNSKSASLNAFSTGTMKVLSVESYGDREFIPTTATS